MEIKVSIENGRVPITVLRVDGSIDSATYEAFQSKVEDLIKDGTKYILVDLANVHFVSSAGLRAFNEIFNQLRKLSPDKSDQEMRKGISAGTYKSPYLKLLNPSKETLTTLKTSGFDMYVEIYKDLKTAVSSF